MLEIHIIPNPVFNTIFVALKYQMIFTKNIVTCNGFTGKRFLVKRANI